MLLDDGESLRIKPENLLQRLLAEVTSLDPEPEPEPGPGPEPEPGPEPGPDPSPDLDPGPNLDPYLILTPTLSLTLTLTLTPPLARWLACRAGPSSMATRGTSMASMRAAAATTSPCSRSVMAN